MNLFELMNAQRNNLTPHDIAVLADWASEEAKKIPNKEWKRAYSLIREGADLLLRRQARSTCAVQPFVCNPDDSIVSWDGQTQTVKVTGTFSTSTLDPTHINT